MQGGVPAATIEVVLKLARLTTSLRGGAGKDAQQVGVFHFIPLLLCLCSVHLSASPRACAGERERMHSKWVSCLFFLLFLCSSVHLKRLTTSLRGGAGKDAQTSGYTYFFLQMLCSDYLVFIAFVPVCCYFITGRGMRAVKCVFLTLTYQADSWCLI